jgi:hypothetical protein
MRKVHEGEEGVVNNRLHPIMSCGARGIIVWLWLKPQYCSIEDIGTINNRRDRAGDQVAACHLIVSFTRWAEVRPKPSTGWAEPEHEMSGGWAAGARDERNLRHGEWAEVGSWAEVSSGGGPPATKIVLGVLFFIHCSANNDNVWIFKACSSPR